MSDVERGRGESDPAKGSHTTPGAEVGNTEPIEFKILVTDDGSTERRATDIDPAGEAELAHALDEIERSTKAVADLIDGSRVQEFTQQVLRVHDELRDDLERSRQLLERSRLLNQMDELVRKPDAFHSIEFIRDLIDSRDQALRVFNNPIRDALMPAAYGVSEPVITAKTYLVGERAVQLPQVVVHCDCADRHGHQADARRGDEAKVTASKEKSNSVADLDAHGGWRMHRSGKKLFGWKEITSAIGSSNSRSNQRHLRDLSTRSDGPICASGAKGVFADEGALKHWMATIEDELDSRSESRKSIPRLDDKGAQIQHDVHEEQRLNSRGRAGTHRRKERDPPPAG